LKYKYRGLQEAKKRVKPDRWWQQGTTIGVLTEHRGGWGTSGEKIEARGGKESTQNKKQREQDVKGEWATEKWADVGKTEMQSPLHLRPIVDLSEVPTVRPEGRGSSAWERLTEKPAGTKRAATAETPLSKFPWPRGNFGGASGLKKPKETTAGGCSQLKDHRVGRQLTCQGRGDVGQRACIGRKGAMTYGEHVFRSGMVKGEAIPSR